MKKDKQKFNERISELIKIFNDVDKVAYYLNQDVEKIGRWSNSDTLTEAPCHIDYTFLLWNYPKFNEEWLKEGIGEMFNSGTKEENKKEIIANEFNNKLKKDAIIITEELGLDPQGDTPQSTREQPPSEE